MKCCFSRGLIVDLIVFSLLIGNDERVTMFSVLSQKGDLWGLFEFCFV